MADTAAGVTVASEEAAAVTSSQRHSRSHLSERSGVEGSRGIRFTVSPRDSSTSLGMTEAAGKYGQDWIRTSEGVKPADLQSAPFGHFGTYPLAGGISYILALHSLQLALAFAAVDSSNVAITF